MEGVPKTIDNDQRHRLHLRLRHHVNIATEANDRLHTTATPPSGHRGRGDGPARGLDRPTLARGRRQHDLIPERPYDIDRIIGESKHRFAMGQAPIVVVAEGATPIEGTMATIEAS